MMPCVIVIPPNMLGITKIITMAITTLTIANSITIIIPSEFPPASSSYRERKGGRKSDVGGGSSTDHPSIGHPLVTKTHPSRDHALRLPALAGTHQHRPQVLHHFVVELPSLHHHGAPLQGSSQTAEPFSKKALEALGSVGFG